MDVRTAAPAFHPERSFKPDSQGQDALPARRQGIAGHLLPPIGGEVNNNANPFRINWKGPLEKKKFHDYAVASGLTEPVFCRYPVPTATFECKCLQKKERVLDCEEKPDAGSVKAGEERKGQVQDAPRISLCFPPSCSPVHLILMQSICPQSKWGHPLEHSVAFSQAPEAYVPSYYILNGVQ